MGFKKLLSNTLDFLSGKSDEAAMKLVESNPELFLSQAIEKEKAAIDELKDNLAQIDHLKKPITQNVEDIKEKMQRIQAQIRKARNDGDSDLEARATQLYKTRDGELDKAIENLEKIEANEEQLRSEIVKAEAAVKQMEIDKDQILADLKIAKSQEQIMEVMGRSKRGAGTADSFNAAKNAINKKTSQIDSKVKVTKSFDSNNTNDPLAGL
ncbi:MAG: PspA/IM30 family protein [Sarcina sp.]